MSDDMKLELVAVLTLDEFLDNKTCWLEPANLVVHCGCNETREVHVFEKTDLQEAA